MDVRRVSIRRGQPGIIRMLCALGITMAVLWLVFGNAILKRNNPNPAPMFFSGGERISREVFLDGMQIFMPAIGPWEDAARARVEAAAICARGKAGYVRKQGAYYVVSNAYADYETARRSAPDDGWEILSASCEGMHLRLTGTQEEIEHILKTENALRRLPDALENLSRDMERGNISLSAGKSMAVALRDEHRALIQTYEQISGMADQRVLAGIYHMENAALEYLNAMAQSKNDDAMALCSAMRHAAVALKLAYIEYASALTP